MVPRRHRGAIRYMDRGHHGQDRWQSDGLRAEHRRHADDRIISLIWLAIVFWWYMERSSRTSKYRAAIAKSPDEFYLDDFGITWGVQDVASTRIGWAAVAFYRLNKSRLELGLPAGVIEVPISDLDEEVDPQELERFLQSKAVRKGN